MNYKNIFYFKKISAIGGTEQFLYEIAKKYNEYDITIFYDEADQFQLQRLRKLVRCRKRVKGEVVKCNRAFFNFNDDMINDVEADEYYFVSHANFEEIGYKPPIKNEKFTNYIGVSQFASTKLDKYAKKIGKEIKTEKCYNPLSLEKNNKVKIIVSACRLDDEVKGGKRTIKLVEALDRYCINNPDKHYLWLIFTNPCKNIRITSPNIILMKPRIDVRPYIEMADYVAQLSNDMETYCYTINEALGYGVPIITTPLSICKELPIDDNMRIELKYDCSNVNEVARQIFEKEVTPFIYIPPKDDWSKFLVKGKSTYKEEQKKRYLIESIKYYYDFEKENYIKTGIQWEVSCERKDWLVEKGLVKVIKEVEQNTIK